MSYLETRLHEKIKYLYEMLKKYNELNNNTNDTYRWRADAIGSQIQVLEDLRDNKNTNWDECYKEDLRES